MAMEVGQEQSQGDSLPSPAPEAIIEPIIEPKPKNPQPPQLVRKKRRPWGSNRDRYRPISWNSYKIDDINCLPPIEIDEDGFAVRPPLISRSRRRGLTENQRKVRFLAMYNYTCGNITFSCQEAGILRNAYEEWVKTDPVFTQKMRDIKIEIAERAEYRLWMSLGLIRPPKDVKLTINSSPLINVIKNLKPGLFADLGGPDPGDPAPEVQDNIPRSAG